MYEEVGNVYGAYTLVQKRQLKNVNGWGYVLSHNKTKARVAVIQNDDDNKVFNIGFRTPPANDTGVPHIMEHSVLCGSKKFPVKDPFVDLAKGSLNTFLNAMTFPDKTVYPVASCNEKDFQNLMDVYLDAVFHPNIYVHEEILKQEGWHYECNDKEEPIIYNGVVYNEMKGVFSAPESKVERLNLRTLYPDTPYRFESGGDPDAIYELTYEEFLAFHQKFYHPSNCYICLYGDMDMEEKLRFIDEEYLSEYDYLEVDSAIARQKPFANMKEVSGTYAITEEEEEKDKTFFSYNVAVGETTDATLYIAMKILEYVLINVSGAPLKKALIDAGIGKDISSSNENSIRQPMFSIIAMNANEEQRDDFYRVLMDTLKGLVKDGLNRKSLEAAINLFEFREREANFGSYPKGLMYGLNMFDSWLYDDEKVFDLLDVDEIFVFLREHIDTGYFEQLIQTYFIENTHAALVTVTPEKNLAKKQDEELAKKLKAYKDSLSDEQLDQLIADNHALKEYQEREDSKEDKAKLPMLKISDIEKKAKPYVNEEIMVADTKVVTHSLFTNGITYLNFSFDMRSLPLELLPVSSILVSLLKEVDTEHYTYQELASEIGLHIGGLSFSTITYKNDSKPGGYGALFQVQAKAFHNKVDKAVELMREVLFTSNLDDDKRIKEIVAAEKVALHSQLMNSGHVAMANRAMSCYDEMAAYKERTDMVDYYHYLEELQEHFDERIEELKEQLKKTARYIFTDNHLMVSITTDQNVKELLKSPLEKFKESLYDNYEAEPCRVPLNDKREGFMTSSKVQYVACAGNFKEAGYDYTGALLVLKMIFSYEYLWMNIRVKGGAYGCGCSFSRFGNGYFTSYRDPNLARTYQIYEEAADYVKAFAVDERTMTQYIIGAISMLDQPMTPSAFGAASFAAYLQGITNEEKQQERDEVLAADAKAIQALAPIVKAIYDKKAFAALGNQETVKKETQYFDEMVVLK